MDYGETDIRIGNEIKARGYTFPIIFDVGGSNGSWVNVMSKVFPDSRFELFEVMKRKGMKCSFTYLAGI